jgi:hypothetical protein
MGLHRPRRGTVPIVVVSAVLLLSGALASAAVSVEISGASPYPDGGDPTDPLAVTECNGEPQTGVLYRNSETEPHLAVNPTNPLNMIAGWHQDRWSNGAAQGLGAAYTFDGGATWTSVNIPFTRCSGGAPGTAGDYGRASDPWISFGPDGTAHFMALAADNTPNRNAMTVARSTDGGVTWTAPQVIKAHPGRDSVAASLFHDKNTITADPFDPDLVYATWTLFRNGVTSLLVARSTDGGETWEPPRPIATFGTVQPGEVAFFRQGAQIVVLPDGTLVNVFFRILFDQKNVVITTEQALLRSTDGKHWERVDIAVDEFVPATAFDPELGIPVRDAGAIPDVAVSASGELYLTWQRANAEGLVEVVVARSIDGGLTWSAPNRVSSQPTDVQSFLPAVSVNADGTVGVLYYDFRNDVLGDATLDTDVHLALFDAALDPLDERTLTSASFDMRQMVITGDRGYFPGDYVGLDTAGDDFVAAFTAANNLGLPVDFPQPEGLVVDVHDRQDIVFARETP